MLGARPAPPLTGAAPLRAAVPALVLNGASPPRMEPPLEPAFSGLNPRPLARPYGGMASSLACGHVGMQVRLPPSLRCISPNRYMT